MRPTSAWCVAACGNGLFNERGFLWAPRTEVAQSLETEGSCMMVLSGGCFIWVRQEIFEFEASRGDTWQPRAWRGQEGLTPSRHSPLAWWALFLQSVHTKSCHTGTGNGCPSTVSTRMRVPATFQNLKNRGRPLTVVPELMRAVYPAVHLCVLC